MTCEVHPEDQDDPDVTSKGIRAGSSAEMDPPCEPSAPDRFLTRQGETVRRIDVERLLRRADLDHYRSRRIVRRMRRTRVKRALAGDPEAIEQLHELAGLVVPQIAEYSEGEPVRLITEPANGNLFADKPGQAMRVVFYVDTQYGHAGARIDAQQLVDWILSPEGRAALARRGIAVPTLAPAPTPAPEAQASHGSPLLDEHARFLLAELEREALEREALERAAYARYASMLPLGDYQQRVFQGEEDAKLSDDIEILRRMSQDQVYLGQGHALLTAIGFVKARLVQIGRADSSLILPTPQATRELPPPDERQPPERKEAMNRLKQVQQSIANDPMHRAAYARYASMLPLGDYQGRVLRGEEDARLSEDLEVLRRVSQDQAHIGHGHVPVSLAETMDFIQGRLDRIRRADSSSIPETP